MGYVTKKAAQRFEEKKAAIYVRVSTQYQVDRASLPVQREELINYAKYALGISDYVIFEDAGYSAKNTDRPDYQQMMARMRTGEFSHLLVWKIDRISRNLLDFSVMYAELKELGVVFVSKNEQFDTSAKQPLSELAPSSCPAPMMASGTAARFPTGTPTTKRARPSPSPRTRPKSSV